jgi:hypothetical protein
LLPLLVAADALAADPAPVTSPASQTPPADKVAEKPATPPAMNLLQAIEEARKRGANQPAAAANPFAAAIKDTESTPPVQPAKSATGG